MPFLKENTFDVADVSGVFFQYPGTSLEVELIPQTREERQQRLDKCRQQRRGFRNDPFAFDDKKHNRLLAHEVFLSWRGMDQKTVSKLVLIKPDALKSIGAEGLQFSTEDAEFILNNNADFRLWIDECLDNYEAFNQAEKERLIKNSPTG
jgi:hypothetical protein